LPKTQDFLKQKKIQLKFKLILVSLECFQRNLERNVRPQVSSNEIVARVDKRGRKVESTVAGDLKRFYKLEKEDISSEEESLNGIESNRIDLARGEGDIESSDEEFDSDQEAALQEEASGPWADEEIPTGDETNRLACVNLDWDHVKARDLYKVFDGFKPSNGIIKNVTIYPSEFGKEAMAKEALAGPPSEVFNQKEQDATAPLSKREKKRAATKARKEAERAGKPQAADAAADEGKDFNTVALRKYQMERLRYYYAVVECESLACAKAIFASCDGTEFESSGNFIDLRYIPDGMSFDDEPRDTAQEAPAAYQPVEFVTQALQHSSVKLTWDTDDPERQKTTRKKFSKQDLKDMDFKAYLASDSEENLDELDEETKKKYKALLANGSGEESGGEDMEITFAPGLSEKASKLLEEKKERDVKSMLLIHRLDRMNQYLKLKYESKKKRKS
jgi:hypothetical protein